MKQGTLNEFSPMLHDLGITTVMDVAGSALRASKPAAGWQQSLNPGESVAGVLVPGDMSITGLGTVTYNDGKRVVVFGHPFFNLGPVDMPMSKGEVLIFLSSSYQPNKVANATEIAGALHQDRHSGITGLGQASGLRATWKAADALNVIERAEYSLDGKDWALIDPTTRLSDSLTLDYALSLASGTPGEHILAVRITDEYSNTAVAKVSVT